MSKSYTLEDCIKVAGEKGGFCLSTEYVSANTSMDWKCSSGHIWSTKFSHILRGSWCSKCNGKARHDIEYCRKIGEGKNLKLISTEYKDANSPLIWKCKNGHVVNSSVSNIRRQKFPCSKCFTNSRKATLQNCLDAASSKEGYCLSIEYTDAHVPMVWKCKNSHIWTADYNHIQQGEWCPKCSHIVSNPELEIREYLISLGIREEEMVYNKPQLDKYHIDIYIPGLKLGIEYHGLYWHSYESLLEKRVESDFNPKKFHKVKADLADREGIKLLQIFEDEWRDKRDRVKDIISQCLGCNSGDSFYARKCEIADTSYQDAVNFLNNYHFQGAGNVGSIRHGLYYKDKLVALMTWTNNKYSSGFKKESGIYELYKFATCGRVPGGLSKLLSYFEDRYSPRFIFTFADRRYFNGNSFIRAGFSLDSTTDPNYFYFNKKNLKREHRFAHKKNKEAWELGLTEYEYWKDRGWYRIYDAGHIKLIKKY
jgi:hypothetical protein